MSLFQHNGEMSLEKTGAPVKQLSDNPNTQQTEIYAELYRTNQYLGRYQVELVELGNEPERGYMYGYFAITPPRAVPPQAPGRTQAMNPSLHQEMLLGTPVVRIPIIVKSRMLSPLDVFITPDKKFLPLTQERLESAIQQLHSFEMGPQQMDGSSYLGGWQGSPAESDAPRRAGDVGMKTGAALLDCALTTLTDGRKEALLGVVRNDPDLRVALQKNAAFASAIRKISEAPTHSAADMQCSVMDNLPADVVYFEAIDGTTRNGVKVKAALAKAYAVVEKTISPKYLDLIPTDVMREMHKTGSAQRVVNPAPVSFPADVQVLDCPEDCSIYGAVTKEAGAAMLGVAVPTVKRFDGSETGLTIFVGADRRWSMQDKIASVKIPNGPEPVAALVEASDEIGQRQYGCFVKLSSPVEVTIPMYIGPVTRKGDEVYYHYGTEDPVGPAQVGQFTLLEGLEKVAFISHGVYGIPADWRWLPLEEHVALLEEAESLHKTAEAEDIPVTVVIRQAGNEYFLGGPPVESLGKEHLHHLKEADARFVLGALGVDNAVASVALSRASQANGISKIAVSRNLRPYADEVDKVKTKVSSAFMQWLSLHVQPVDLIKEAAMSDPESVDSVLALGLITPDNLMAFLDHMLPLEDTASRLAQMLVLARLGQLPELSETAIERSMKATDKVLSGLRALRVRLESPEADDQEQ